ncbi:MAG: response regulator [Anaerolineae bacterium]|nr:response regulator [Anaerolineae bacterium]
MKLRILLIDDEPRWIEFARRDLESFEIVVATSQEEAEAELEKDRFTLVIASSRWLSVLELIRDKYADKQVMVTTIKPTPEEALNAYRRGAVDYIPKSFANQELLEHVKKVVPTA